MPEKCSKTFCGMESLESSGNPCGLEEPRSSLNDDLAEKFLSIFCKSAFIKSPQTVVPYSAIYYQISAINS